MKTYLKNLNPLVLEYKEIAKNYRRELHQIPELSTKEYETQAFLIEKLKSLGYEPKEVVDTGVYVYLPGNLEGATVALRSDIDALPVKEENGLPYASRHPGVMHACGHDGHMSMLLTTLQILAEHPEIEHRNLLAIFQPAEEGPGGAERIIKTGLLDEYNVGEIYGYHLFPFVEEGTVSTTPGAMMAMNAEFVLEVKGKASHAGQPEDGVDALIPACEFVLDVQALLSRELNPNETVIVNIGTFEAGEKMNILPGRARLTGTVRTYSKKTLEYLKLRMSQIVEGLDKSFRTNSDFAFTAMYPPVINHDKLAKKVLEIAPEPVTQFDKVSLAEDFAFYTEKLPGVFVGLGTGNKDQKASLHTKDFNFSEGATCKLVA